MTVHTSILCRHRDLQKAKDKDGNTPLQYLSSKTPLAAIKALDPLDEHLAREEAVSIPPFKSDPIEHDLDDVCYWL